MLKIVDRTACQWDVFLPEFRFQAVLIIANLTESFSIKHNPPLQEETTPTSRLWAKLSQQYRCEEKQAPEAGVSRWRRGRKIETVSKQTGVNQGEGTETAISCSECAGETGRTCPWVAAQQVQTCCRRKTFSLCAEDVTRAQEEPKYFSRSFTRRCSWMFVFLEPQISKEFMVFSFLCIHHRTDFHVIVVLFLWLVPSELTIHLPLV